MNNSQFVEAANAQTFPRGVINYRARTWLISLAGDVMALLLAAGLAHTLLNLSTAATLIGEIEHLLFVIICLSLLMTSRLYPGIGLNPAMEIKTVTQLTLVSFFIVFSFLMYQNPAWSGEKISLVLNAIFALPSLLLLRWLVRISAVQIGVWGEPVALIAPAEKAATLINYLHERRRFGFLPTLIGLPGPLPPGASFEHPLVKSMTLSDLLLRPSGYFAAQGISTALVDTQTFSGQDLSEIQQKLLKKFQRVIFLTGMDWLVGVSINHYDLEGLFGIEAQQTIPTPPLEWIKRTLDIIIALTAGLLTLPMLLMAALLIKIESPGPIFYRQPRLGKKWQIFSIYKFRTMHENAEKMLAEYLKNHPAARQEWEHSQKLKNDPRITRVGAWLRKFSIDELPQLWNVLRGEMSAVGPRPILVEQARLYGDALRVYSQVRPGLTGFWQVSGRNRTSFAQRANFDVYYVRNWSIWLDIYILLRTVWVVLSRDGAY